MALEEQTISRAVTEDAHKEAPKPAKLSDMSGSSWKYIFKRALSEFTNDGCTDLAAALTYFTVLSIFPGLLAVVSLLGVFGQGQQTTNAILNFLQDYAPAEMLTLLEEPITQLTSSDAAGLALVTGVVGALWTASGYIGAFGRSMNKIYGVVEGRPIWKLRPFNLLVTAAMVLIVVAMMLVLLSSEDVLTCRTLFPLSNSVALSVYGCGCATPSCWFWPLCSLACSTSPPPTSNSPPSVSSPPVPLLPWS